MQAAAICMSRNRQCGATQSRIFSGGFSSRLNIASPFTSNRSDETVGHINGYCIQTG